MKCIVCSETIKSGQSRCSFCGFPVIAGTAGTDAERQAISEVGAAYYRAQMKKISIDLVTYPVKLKMLWRMKQMWMYKHKSYGIRRKYVSFMVEEHMNYVRR